MKIKENITLVDKINVIESIVASYFTDGEYTPYYSDIAEVIAIITYFIDDLEIPEDTDPYDFYLENEELQDLVRLFRVDQYDNERFYKMFQFVTKNVNDKVDFMKQQAIHYNEALGKIGNLCEMFTGITNMSQEDIDVTVDVMKKLQKKGVTEDSLVEVIKEAVDFKLDEASAEIIDAKNTQLRDKDKKIAELEKYRALWESRNVTA